MKISLELFDLVPLDLQMILVGIVLFAILLETFRRFVFAPYLDLTVAREEATIGAEERAQNNRDQAELVQHDYQNQIQEERQKSLKNKVIVVSRAKAEAGKLVSAAEAEAREYVRGVRDRIKDQLASSRKLVVHEGEKTKRHYGG